MFSGLFSGVKKKKRAKDSTWTSSHNLPAGYAIDLKVSTSKNEVIGELKGKTMKVPDEANSVPA